METMSEHYQRAFGKFIKKARIERKMTQVELSWNEEESREICSVRELQYIEKGEGKVKPVLMEQLMERLGIDLKEWEKEVDREIKGRFDNAFDRIERDLVKKRYEKAREGYQGLIEQTYYPKKRAYYRQHLGYLEVSIEKDEDGQKQEAIEGLRKILKISKPALFLKDGRVNIEYLASNICTLIEYRMLNLLSTKLTQEEAPSDSKAVTEALISSLKLELVEIGIKRKLLPGACFNLSNDLFDVGAYEEMLEVCREGIEVGLGGGLLEVIPYLKYNEGKALWYLGRKEGAFIKFKGARDLFLALEEPHNADHIEEITAEKYRMDWNEVRDV